MNGEHSKKYAKHQHATGFMTKKGYVSLNICQCYILVFNLLV